MKGLKKQKGREHWTMPYAYAGRRSKVHIYLEDNRDSAYFGKYLILCGAVMQVKDDFEEAKAEALRLTHGGAIA